MNTRPVTKTAVYADYCVGILMTRDEHKASDKNYTLCRLLRWNPHDTMLQKIQIY